MARLVTLSVCVLALVATLAEATSNRIHVTAKIVETTFTGDLAHPQIGDQLINTVNATATTKLSASNLACHLTNLLRWNRPSA